MKAKNENMEETINNRKGQPFSTENNKQTAELIVIKIIPGEGP